MRRFISFFTLGAALTIVLASCSSSTDVTPTPLPATATVSVPTAVVSPRATVDPTERFSAKYGYKWKTDFTKKSINLDDIVVAGPPRDGIPTIDQPKFISAESASEWLKDQEPVVVYANNGDTKAYPLQILIWHEVINDTVGGEAVAVTYSPLTNTPTVVGRVVDGNTLRFGTTGLLRNGNLIMWDNVTESWWQQATASGIVGTSTGKKLKVQEAQLVTFGDFKAGFPNSNVLSQQTGFSRNYGTNVYNGYDTSKPFAFPGKPDERLAVFERVLVITVENTKRAYPFSALKNKAAVNEKIGKADIVVFWKSGAVSAVDKPVIADSKNVGTATAFSSVVNGQKLTFDAKDGTFTDIETGSEWNILGTSTSGPMKGSRLKPLIAINSFWFAWAAFNPETTVYNG